MLIRSNCLSIVLFLSLFSANSLLAQEATDEPPEDKKESFFAQFEDPEDGKFDVSDFLLDSLHGFLPVPLIITEPAVDNGLGLAGAFFHKPKDDQMQPGDKNMILPNISVVGGVYTGNGSWAVGGGHFRNWSEDHFRYNIVGGYANVNLDWYGGGDFPEFDRGLLFNMEGALLDQEFLMRVGDSRWFLGGGLKYLNSEVSFDLGLPIDLDPIQNTVAGASAIARYENLDFRLGPRQGLQLEMIASANREEVGSDYNYNQITWQYRQYMELSDRSYLSWRFDGSSTHGDVPFYLEPFIILQGIPAMRYQGPTAAVVEVRGGFDITPRWSVLAFAGSGSTADDISGLTSSESHSAYGAGFRYLMARKLGLRVGIDVAKGPEDTYGYLIVGTSWY